MFQVFTVSIKHFKCLTHNSICTNQLLTFCLFPLPTIKVFGTSILQCTMGNTSHTPSFITPLLIGYF